MKQQDCWKLLVTRLAKQTNEQQLKQVSSRFREREELLQETGWKGHAKEQQMLPSSGFCMRTYA